jgi:hypothetical protein
MLNVNVSMQAHAFSMCQGVNLGLREGAYQGVRISDGFTNRCGTRVFQKGLQDADSIDVSPP